MTGEGGVVQEEGPGGLPFLAVETERCRARLTPYGAQVCEWTPAGQSAPVLFLSPRARFESGAAIRGGVPVCFPWFGPHPEDAARPAHGFARTRPWQTGGVVRDEAGDVHVTFHLVADRHTRALWPAEFAADLTVSLGSALALRFAVENTGDAALTCEVALHTYLTVGDVEAVRVHGLERTRYLDKADGMREKTTAGAPLAVTGEVDRVFVDTAAPCTVEDPVLGRRLRVEKTGSPVTVVWNPGPRKGPAVPDLGEAWRRFLCVETAHCQPRPLRLPPGARHGLTARITVEA